MIPLALNNGPGNSASPRNTLMGLELLPTQLEMYLLQAIPMVDWTEILSQERMTSLSPSMIPQAQNCGPGNSASHQKPHKARELLPTHLEMSLSQAIPMVDWTEILSQGRVTYLSLN